eukprot:scaffold2804_cov371-Prasinococcus_capsulatus_cf.AAC.19
MARRRPYARHEVDAGTPLPFKADHMDMSSRELLAGLHRSDWNPRGKLRGQSLADGEAATRQRARAARSRVRHKGSAADCTSKRC